MTPDEIKTWDEKHPDISTETIVKDIADTQAEIDQYEQEIPHLESTPLHMREARLNHMRADTRKIWIQEREEFIKKLKDILSYRNEKYLKTLSKIAKNMKHG